MNIADALSGRTKLKGIHWLLLSTTARKLLRDRLRALLFPGAVLGRCHLRHVRFRPGLLLTAYYEVQVQVGGNGAYRPIAVTWASGSHTDQHHDVTELARMQAEAVHRGVAAPFSQLIADFPEWRMGVWVSPLDTRFTQLLRVSDPQHVRAMLADAYASGSAGSDRRRNSDYTVTSIKYRPGKRHVLRYDPVGLAKGGTVFAKLYVGDDGARAFRVTRCAADWLAEHGEGVHCAQPLAYVAEDAVILYPRVYGTPLSAQLRRPSASLAHYWQRAGTTLNALHRLPEAGAGPLEPHDFVAEVRETARASDHIRALLPQVGAAIDALLDRALEMYERLPQEPPTFTHGDFKSEHIWVAAGELTLIDFHSRLADPALDVGKFLADLRLWHATYNRPGLVEAQQSFLAAYGRSVPNERLLRSRLYEAVEVVKMAAHGSDLTLGATGRVRMLKRDWAFRTARLVGHAQTVINRLHSTLGLPAPAVGKPIPQLPSKALPPAASNSVQQSACRK